MSSFFELFFRKPLFMDQLVLIHLVVYKAYNFFGCCRTDQADLVPEMGGHLG